MSIDKSLRRKNSLQRARSVLTRDERIKTMMDNERWPEGRPMSVRISGNLSTDSGDALREAAANGLGISQATWWLFRKDLDNGAVVPILDTYQVEAEPISIVFAGQGPVPARVRAVIDFFADLTRSHGALSDR